MFPEARYFSTDVVHKGHIFPIFLKIIIIQRARWEKHEEICLLFIGLVILLLGCTQAHPTKDLPRQVKKVNVMIHIDDHTGRFHYFGISINITYPDPNTLMYYRINWMRKTKLCLVLYLQPCVMDSCLFGAESSLRLLACRGRTASLLRQGKNLRGLAGTLFPQAPEHLRFDSWPRHWAIGLKTGQNYVLSLPVKKTTASFLLDKESEYRIDLSASVNNPIQAMKKKHKETANHHAPAETKQDLPIRKYITPTKNNQVVRFAIDESE